MPKRRYWIYFTSSSHSESDNKKKDKNWGFIQLFIFKKRFYSFTLKRRKLKIHFWNYLITIQNLALKSPHIVLKARNLPFKSRNCLTTIVTTLRWRTKTPFLKIKKWILNSLRLNTIWVLNKDFRNTKHELQSFHTKLRFQMQIR